MNAPPSSTEITASKANFIRLIGEVAEVIGFAVRQGDKAVLVGQPVKTFQGVRVGA